MSTTPNPFNRKDLTRALIVGAVLAVLGIVLFFVLWGALGQSGTGQAARLFVSLCVPPVIIGVIIGVYFLFFKPRA